MGTKSENTKKNAKRDNISEAILNWYKSFDITTKASICLLFRLGEFNDTKGGRDLMNEIVAACRNDINENLNEAAINAEDSRDAFVFGMLAALENGNC